MLDPWMLAALGGLLGLSLVLTGAVRERSRSLPAAHIEPTDWIASAVAAYMNDDREPYEAVPDFEAAVEWALRGGELEPDGRAPTATPAGGDDVAESPIDDWIEVRA